MMQKYPSKPIIHHPVRYSSSQIAIETKDEPLDKAVEEKEMILQEHLSFADAPDRSPT